MKFIEVELLKTKKEQEPQTELVNFDLAQSVSVFDTQEMKSFLKDGFDLDWYESCDCVFLTAIFQDYSVQFTVMNYNEFRKLLGGLDATLI